jgi:hypothetical protein
MESSVALIELDVDVILALKYFINNPTDVNDKYNI